MFPVTSLCAWMCALWYSFRGHIITCESGFSSPRGSGGMWFANTYLTGQKLLELVKFDASFGRRLKDAYLICTHIYMGILTCFFMSTTYVYNASKDRQNY